MELIKRTDSLNRNRDMDLNFALDLIEGLEKSPKSIPSKYLYDERGSQLFDQITELPEYYVTQIEKDILNSLDSKFLNHLVGTSEVIEFGGGDGSKAEIILSKMGQNSVKRFMCVDISKKATQETIQRLTKKFDHLEIKSHIGDYDSYFSFNSYRPSKNSRLFLYLGSNIGNFDPDDALRFLIYFQQGMNEGDKLLIGFDLKKDIPTLTRAYNDSMGVTAEFNLNLLDRINREMGGHFRKDLFYHHEFYNPIMGAMQSYLISKKEQNVLIERLNRSVHFESLEPLHIEDSFKFTLKEIQDLAAQAGFSVLTTFTDERHYFADSLWIKI